MVNTLSLIIRLVFNPITNTNTMGFVLTHTSEVKRNRGQSFANWQGFKMPDVITLKSYIGRNVTLRTMREPRIAECMEKLQDKLD